MRTLLLVGLILSTFVAQAQEASALDGRWTGWMKSSTGQVEVKLTLKGASGEMQFYPQPMQSRNRPCLLQVHPVSLAAPGTEPATLVLEGSKLGGDCEDSTATLLHKGDELTLNFSSGTQGTLKRR